MEIFLIKAFQFLLSLSLIVVLHELGHFIPAKLFKTKVKFLAPRKGERYASALTNMSLSNKVHKNFGKINLKDYIHQFLKKNPKN